LGITITKEVSGQQKSTEKPKQQRKAEKVPCGSPASWEWEGKLKMPSQGKIHSPGDRLAILDAR
jgi:hypothetical protein